MKTIKEFIEGLVPSYIYINKIKVQGESITITCGDNYRINMSRDYECFNTISTKNHNYGWGEVDIMWVLDVFDNRTKIFEMINSGAKLM